MKSKPREATKRNHVQVIIPTSHGAHRWPYHQPVCKQVCSSKKEKRDFEDLSLAQSIARHTGTIWTMKFSHDGARLVSGGQDTILRVWKVQISADESSRTQSNADEKCILDPDPEQMYQVGIRATSSYPMKIADTLSFVFLGPYDADCGCIMEPKQLHSIRVHGQGNYIGS